MGVGEEVVDCDDGRGGGRDDDMGEGGEVLALEEDGKGSVGTPRGLNDEASVAQQSVG